MESALITGIFVFFLILSSFFDRLRTKIDYFLLVLRLFNAGKYQLVLGHFIIVRNLTRHDFKFLVIFYRLTLHLLRQSDREKRMNEKRNDEESHLESDYWPSKSS